ncbi:MAG: YncE family protein [Actinomycetota bacterium]|nr:YncE family protein [Actinomycetota bacterium]
MSASRLHRWLNAGRASLLTAGLVVLLAACSTISWAALGIGTGADGRVIPVLPSTSPPPPRPPVASVAALPGMPAVTDWRNVYAAGARGMLSATAERAKELVYVPHSKSGDVWVIDPSSFQVIATYPAGIELQHVVPSYDLRTLYATDDRGNAVLPFDPTTGKPGAKIPVVDPYNLYFTPDGAFAISVAERLRTLVWYDPTTWQQRGQTPIPGCAGIDHGDFTADGRTAVFTCEFAGRVAVVDVVSHQLLRLIDMPQRNSHMGPQDIRLSPDGAVFYIADSDAGGLWVLDGAATRVLRFIRTGKGAHGLVFDRDAKRLFVADRLQGSICVLDAVTGAVEAIWPIPGGGSPDMGNVTADGTQLWLSGRYNRAVYVLSTRDGSLVRKINVGNGPHGVDVWPQPGRYSLGHTGITR